MTAKPVQGATPRNVDNLSATNTRPRSATVDLTTFMTQSKVQAMLRREKSKASASSIYFDLKSPYSVEVAGRSMRVFCPQLQKFEAQRGNNRDNIVRFLDSMGVFPTMLTFA